MCAARISGCINGCAEEAAGAAGPVMASRMLDWTEAGPRILHSLEMGTVMTVFYQKKSQRPERRTVQIKHVTRQIVWSRNPDKPEGESEYLQKGIVCHKMLRTAATRHQGHFACVFMFQLKHRLVQLEMSLL